MKSLTLLLTTIFLFSSPVVWGEEVEFGDLIERDGLYYKKFSEEPFSGTVCCEWRGKIVKGNREGKWTHWDDNGQLFSRINYKNGEWNGLFETYYRNGQLWGRKNFKNDEIDGLSKSYYENGQLEWKRYFKNGKPDGLWEDYYENGQLKRRGYNTDGKKVGEWEFYNEDGTKP